MKFYYDNKVDLASITSSSIKTGTSISNLIHKHLSKRFSFNDDNGTIDMDLGISTNIKKILIGGSNMTDSATVTLEASLNSDYSTIDFTTVVDLYDTTWAKNLDENYRYWRLSCSDTGLSYLWIGYLYLGNYLLMPGINPNYTLNYQTTSKVILSVSLQPYGDVGIRNFKSKFTFPIITDYEVIGPSGEALATRADILEMWYEVEGGIPFYCEVAENKLDIIPPIFGIINQGSLKFKLDKDQNFYKFSLTFQETK